MSNFASALQAFQGSQLRFDELLNIANAMGQASAADLAVARQFLDAEFQAGRVSQDVYSSLETALNDTTRLAQPTTVDDATRIESAATTTATTNTLDTESLLDGLNQHEPRQELAVGSILKNRFELLELLGVGGMGMVFKATDLRKIEAADKDPYVALKVLNQDFQSNPMALIALQRETKRAQTLSHPNIIKVYDFDRDSGHVFMSMEYLEGQSLAQLIKQHPKGLPFKKAWPLIVAMADALRHAHQKQIVHSDFKPGNVIIDKNGEVRVLDFGIACAMGRNDEEHQDATIFNARSLGAFTPAYASPEQLQNRNPDPRDDIYALACVSYELLTGKHPFGRLAADKALEVNLSVKSIAGLSRRQFKGLQKALAFEQAQRTLSVNEFLKALSPRSTMFYGLWATAILLGALLGVNIYLNRIAPVHKLDAPQLIAPLSPEQQQKIKDLIELAGIHADVGYLTAPTGSNALWAYQEVLKIDPYNQAAASGILKIADTLEQQAWEAYESADRSLALKKVQEGLEANPAHKGLLSLREKLRSNP